MQVRYRAMVCDELLTSTENCLGGGGGITDLLPNGTSFV